MEGRKLDWLVPRAPERGLWLIRDEFWRTLRSVVVTKTRCSKAAEALGVLDVEFLSNPC